MRIPTLFMPMLFLRVVTGSQNWRDIGDLQREYSRGCSRHSLLYRLGVFLPTFPVLCYSGVACSPLAVGPGQRGRKGREIEHTITDFVIFPDFRFKHLIHNVI